MTGYHTRWVRRPEHAEDPERIAIVTRRVNCMTPAHSRIAGVALCACLCIDQHKATGVFVAGGGGP